MGIIKKYHDKKWTLQFLAALYNSIDYITDTHTEHVVLIKIILPNNKDSVVSVRPMFQNS
jgi:hypothetical protein